MKKFFVSVFVAVALLLQPPQLSASADMWRMMDAMLAMMEWFFGQDRGGVRSVNPWSRSGLSPGSLNSLYPLMMMGGLGGMPGGFGGLNSMSNPFSGGRSLFGIDPADAMRWQDNLPFDMFRGSNRDSIYGRDSRSDIFGRDRYSDRGGYDTGSVSAYSGYEGLDGIWVSPSGERWMVNDNRFTLRDRNGSVSEGTFRLEKDWIVANVSLSAMSVEFQFRQMDNLLLIRDRRGRVMLLNRIYPASSSSTTGRW